jgi:hypothetical protein
MGALILARGEGGWNRTGPAETRQGGDTKTNPAIQRGEGRREPYSEPIPPKQQNEEETSKMNPSD